MLVTREVPLTIRKDAAAAKLQIAYGAVYMPDVVDSQGDFMRAEEIRKVAHSFLAKGTTDAIDTNHNNLKSGSRVVESFISKAGDPDFPIPGSWIVGIHVPDPVLWEQIEKGEIGGLSMEVMAHRHMDQPVADRKLKNAKAKGRTYKSGDHDHEYELEFAADGSIIGGITTEVNGHRHKIRAGKTGVITEEADGTNPHRHRFSTVEHFEQGEATLTKADVEALFAEEPEQDSRVDWLLKTADDLAPRIARLQLRIRNLETTAASSGVDNTDRRAELTAELSRLQAQARGERVGPTPDELDRSDRRGAGAANGRVWVRGFYRRTGNGQTWVRGHYQNRAAS